MDALTSLTFKRLNSLPLRLLALAMGLRPMDNDGLCLEGLGARIHVDGDAYRSADGSLLGRGSVDLVARLTGLTGDTLVERLLRVEGLIRSGERDRQLRSSFALPVPSVRATPQATVDSVSRAHPWLDVTLVSHLVSLKRLYLDCCSCMTAVMRDETGLCCGAEQWPAGGVSVETSPIATVVGGSDRVGAFYVHGKAPMGPIALCTTALEAMALVSVHPDYSAISMSGTHNPRLMDWLAPALLSRGVEVRVALARSVAADSSAQVLQERFGFTRLAPVARDRGYVSWAEVAEARLKTKGRSA